MESKSADTGAVPPIPGDGIPDGRRMRARVPMPPVEEGEVMRRAVEQALQVSVQKNRNVLSAALAPVVGGALRRAFWNVFKRMVVRLNRFLVLTFSADGMRWHFEALRTGKAFETVVRDHSLVEPVTQVFLIHRRTGLMLAQAKRDSMDGQDGDMVSGMLTAIQDFVHDSFHVKADGNLEVIRVGDVSVLVEQDEHALLAGIVSQNHVPQSLRDTFRRAIRQVHSVFAKELVDFRGDVSVFAPVAPVLESCLKLSIIKGEDRISPLTAMLLTAPVIAGLVWGGLFVDRELRWRAYLADLEHQSGIAVLKTGWRGGQRYVRGLRDPLAADPTGLLLAHGLSADDVHSEWRGYQALDEELILPRVRRMLEMPVGVNMVLRDGVLVLDGIAPMGWKDQMLCRIHMIHGIRGVRMDALIEAGAEEQQVWERYVARLQKTEGIEVLSHGWQDGRFSIIGLRDPFALDPEVLLAHQGIGGDKVHSRWVTYQALEPDLILARARHILVPPASVMLSLREGGVLHLEGSASDAWIRQARIAARGITGVVHLEMETLVNTDYELLEGMAAKLTETVFFYLTDQQNLWPGQENRLNAFIEEARRFIRLARRLDGDFVIWVQGHAPASKDVDVARLASMAVADRFYSRLQQAGMDMACFARNGMGSSASPAVAPEELRRRESHVSFKVQLTTR